MHVQPGLPKTNPMTSSLLRSFLLVCSLGACAPLAKQVSVKATNQTVLRTQENARQVSWSRSDTSTVALPDSTWAKPLSLVDLPQSEDGQVVLSTGYYEGSFRSYCLQPGNPDPSDHDAYLQSPLTTYRKDIVSDILRHSLDRNDLKQRDIQLLLWSVVSGSDYKKLSWEVQATAEQLLTRKQVFQLKGGVMGVVRNVSESLPSGGVSSKMKDLFELGNSSYEVFERLAVPRQPSIVHNAEVKKDEWYEQPGGYYLRYFPSGYQQIKIQVYVPQGLLDSSGKTEGHYLLFDPVNLMAVPANSNAQRLGIGAPLGDVIRKIIKISTTPNPPKPVQKPPQKGIFQKRTAGS